MKASRLLIAGSIAALLPLAGAFAQSPAQSPTPAQSESPRQGATFESLDKNSDGRISKTEAAADANVSQQFSHYDKNGNGFIERDEVATANATPPEKPAKQ